jgi:hypothetical protein
MANKRSIIDYYSLLATIFGVFGVWFINPRLYTVNAINLLLAHLFLP